MIHKLCIHCVHICKQTSTVKIMKCPRFEKRVSEKEFRRMVNDVGEIEKQAETIKERIQSLLENIRDNQSSGGED